MREKRKKDEGELVASYPRFVGSIHATCGLWSRHHPPTSLLVGAQTSTTRLRGARRVLAEALAEAPLGTIGMLASAPRAQRGAVGRVDWQPGDRRRASDEVSGSVVLAAIVGLARVAKRVGRFQRLEN